MTHLALNHGLVHCPLSGIVGGLDSLTDRPAALLQGGSVNGSALVLVPLAEQLLLLRPAQLTLLDGQVVVSREAIAHDNPAKAAPQQLLQQRLRLAESQRERTAPHAHQSTEPGPITPGLHISRQGRAGAGAAAG